MTIKQFIEKHKKDFTLNINILDSDGYGVCCRKFANDEIIANRIISEYGEHNIIKSEYGIFDDNAYYLTID